AGRRCFHFHGCYLCRAGPLPCLFFLRDPPPTEIYTLSLHDALPICLLDQRHGYFSFPSSIFQPRLDGIFDFIQPRTEFGQHPRIDRKSTRLNSSHVKISYAVFCLKKTTTSTKRRITKSSTLTPRLLS